jgi:NitT/TauT family transport system substrate-binding protein
MIKFPLRFAVAKRVRGLSAFLGLAGLSAAMTQAPALADDVVRLGNLKFAHYGAVSYMKEVCPKYGIKLEERVFPKGIDILPAVAAGEIDVTATGLDVSIAGRAQGLPLTIAAAFAKGGVRIVATPESGLKSVADFKGKKVGVARGGAQELALLTELDKFGLSWSDKPGKDVQIVYLSSYPDVNQALQGKNIDAMSQSEPYSSQAINKGYGVEVVKPYDTPMGQPRRALVMTEKLYANRDVALRVMKCFVDSTERFIKHPDLAEKYVKEVIFKNQITSQDFKDAIENSPYAVDMTVEHVQITTDFMQKLNVGRMTSPPKAADYVKLDLLQEALASVKVD